MKNHKRLVCFVCAVVLLLSLWIWRYSSLNTYYDSFGNITKNTYHIGDVIPFGNNRIGGFYLANGYSICVDRFEIQDYQQYIHAAGVETARQYAIPEKVALVYITLINDDSSADGVMLTELQLHGIDNYVGMDWDLLTAVNPILEGNMGISLPPGAKASLVLPYEVYRSFFCNKTWKNLEEYKWYLKVTSWPVNQEISLQT